MKYSDVLQHFQNMLLNKEASQQLSEELSCTKQLERGINTYLSNRIEGFYKIFSRIFPKVEKVVTENNFRILVEEYTTQVAGYEGDIAEYSKGFSQFLGQYPNLKQLEWIEELTKLEWLMNRLEYHRNIPLLTTETAKEVSKNPTLIHESFHFTVGQFWAVDNPHDAQLSYFEEAGHYLIWKNEDMQLVWCDSEQLAFANPLFEKKICQTPAQEAKGILGEELFSVAIEQGWMV